MLVHNRKKSHQLTMVQIQNKNEPQNKNMETFITRIKTATDIYWIMEQEDRMDKYINKYAHILILEDKIEDYLDVRDALTLRSKQLQRKIVDPTYNLNLQDVTQPNPTRDILMIRKMWLERELKKVEIQLTNFNDNKSRL